MAAHSAAALLDAHTALFLFIVQAWHGHQDLPANGRFQSPPFSVALDRPHLAEARRALAGPLTAVRRCGAAGSP